MKKTFGLSIAKLLRLTMFLNYGIFMSLGCKVLFIAIQLVQLSEAIPLDRDPPNEETSIPIFPFSAGDSPTSAEPEITSIYSPALGVNETAEDYTGNTSHQINPRKGGGGIRSNEAYITKIRVVRKEPITIIQRTLEWYDEHDISRRFRNPEGKYPNWRNLVEKKGVEYILQYIDFEQSLCMECACRIGEFQEDGTWSLEPNGSSTCPNEEAADDCSIIYGNIGRKKPLEITSVVPSAELLLIFLMAGCYCEETLFKNPATEPYVGGTLLQDLGDRSFLKGDNLLLEDDDVPEIREGVRFADIPHWPAPWYDEDENDLGSYMRRLEGPDIYAGYNDNGGEGSSRGAARAIPGGSGYGLGGARGPEASPPQEGYRPVPPGGGFIEMMGGIPPPSNRRNSHDYWGYISNGKGGGSLFKRSIEDTSPVTRIENNGTEPA
ncbi:hypothetical protein TWF481_000658 [Arthrobotrys musiformis]|uniref:Uncharacterized protein n=1 Tax=Arthrobotrys musiformis TaxID=47236 RepID=A0AAV9WQA0_9PEZI